jgi:hypothetical protein
MIIEMDFRENSLEIRKKNFLTSTISGPFLISLKYLGDEEQVYKVKNPKYKVGDFVNVKYNNSHLSN